MNTQRKLVAALALAFAASAQAAVTADEAKALGTTLTPVGAEKGANKDGTIPAYTGGMTTPPAGYKAGDGIRPNPFASEKPKLSVDAKSMAQHADKLTEGTKAMMQKYPSFRIDVYPTQRTVAFPKFVTDNTLKNAPKAKTTNDGRSIEGAHAGFPFPLPEDRLRGDVEPPGALQRPVVRVEVPQPDGRRQRPSGARHRRQQRPGIPVLGQQPRRAPRPTGASS